MSIIVSITSTHIMVIPVLSHPIVDMCLRISLAALFTALQVYPTDGLDGQLLF